MSDKLYPFLLEHKQVRGRVVRLGDSLTQIVHRHDYPQRISALLAEMLVMAALLSNNLKSGGIITLQLQSKGALSVLMADATQRGHLRGYAQFDADGISDTASLSSLCADGYLAITLDPGAGGQRYQSIVPLDGDSIAATMQHYFTQSQQLRVMTRIAAGQVVEAGQERWIGGGIYIENVPERAEASEDNDLWRDAGIMLHTLRDDELLDSSLPEEDLIYRLYHETGLWVYEPHPISAQCRCSRKKIHSALSGMQAEAVVSLAEDGMVTVDCQFCGRQERFTLSELTVAGET